MHAPPSGAPRPDLASADASLARRIDAAAAVLLRLATWVWLLLAVACVFFTTLGTDEAWVLSGLKSYLTGLIPHQTAEPVSTSGGVFAIANLALEYAFGSRVWVHRLFSLACLLVIVVMAGRPQRGARRGAALDVLAVAPLLGIAGTAEVGTTALGTAPAIMLLVVASWTWASAEAPGLGRSLLCGALFGLAAATRFDLVLFAPALLAVSSVRLAPSGPRLRFPWAALVAVLVGLMVFVANQLLMSAAVHRSATGQAALGETMAVTGIAGSFVDYPRLLNRLMVGVGIVSPGVLALASGVAFCRREGADELETSRRVRLAAVLVATAWVVWVGWLLRAPVPHLRYLWPSLALIALPAGAGLSALHQRYASGGAWSRGVLCRLVALGLVLGGIGGTARSLVLGDSDVLSWEWSREMGLDYFRRFQALRDQRDAIAYLRDRIPHDATVLSYVPHTLRYLGDRPVVDVGGAEASPSPPGRRTFLVLTPAVGTYLYLRPEAFTWIEAEARLVAQFGRYSFYELPEGPPPDPALLRLGRTNYERHPGSQLWFGRHTP